MPLLTLVPSGTKKRSQPIAVVPGVVFGGRRYVLGWRMEAGAPVWRAWVGSEYGPEVTDPGLIEQLRRVARAPAVAA